MTGTVLHIVSGDLWGGSEAQVLFQLKALVNRGVAIELLLFNCGIVAKRYQDAGLKCSVVGEAEGFLKLLKEAIAIVKKIKPQIIVTHGYKENIIGFLLCLVTGAKLVTTFHGLTENYQGLKRLKIKGYFFLNSLIWKFYSKRIVTVSNQLAVDLGISQLNKLWVVWNVIDIDIKSENNYQLFANRPVVLFMGRLVAVKRCDLAIRAVKNLLDSGTEAYLYIAGEGPLENDLKKLVNDLGLADHVKFLGFREDVQQVIADCDVFLISSDSEGIPTVLLEAIYKNKPIVSTRVGGIAEVMAVFNDYPVELVNPNNELALSDGIGRMIKTAPGPEGKLATREKFIQHFSAERAAARLEEIYSELLQE